MSALSTVRSGRARPPAAEPERYVNITTAAEFLGVPVSFLYQRGDAERVPCRRIGRARRYLLSELDVYMRRDAA